MAPTVAIIIPVLNERMLIIDALQRVCCLGADEIIVIDGNSTDGTYESIRDKFPQVFCLKTPFANRAKQMNTGANEAVSDILVFVHADSRLPDDTVSYIQKTMQRGYVGGGFMKKYEPTNLVLNTYGFLLNHIYLRFYKNLVGSNAIFIRRDLFESLKGFPEVNFMEDVLFTKILKEAGRLSVIDEPVIVSSRRYQEHGVLKQIMRNARIIFDYQYLQRGPQELKKVYTVNA